MPVAIFAAILAIFIGLRERDALEQSARSKVHEIVGGIDSYIAAQLSAATIMSDVQSLRDGDLRRFYDFASRTRQRFSGWNNVVVLDGSGQQLINLDRPYGTPLPGVSDLATYQKTLTGKASVIGDLADPGAVSGKMFIPVRVPVLNGAEIKYVVTVDLDPAKLNEFFKVADAPENWIGAVVDRQGHLIGRSVLAAEFVGKFATPVALEAIKTSKEGFYEGSTLEGLETVFAFYTSPLTGWSVHYAVPKSTYNAPLRRVIIFIAAGAIGAGVLAFLLFGLMTRDAAERLEKEKREAEALELSESRLRSVFETTYQFQGLLTLDGRLIDANPISLKAIDSSLKDVAGLPLWETAWFAKTPGMSDELKTAIAKVTAGNIVRNEVEIDLPTGVRTFDFALRPVLDRSGRPIAILSEAMELSERKEAEEKVRQLQKMEAIGQLTGGIAHDFNNMLAIIIGSINLYRRRSARGDADVDKYLQSALDGAEKAASLTRRLLAFSRQQPLSPRSIQLNALIADLSELLRRTLGETIELETVLAAGLWKIHADAAELENVLVNLAINARDAMAAGGKLTIETHNAYLDAEYCGQNDIANPGQYALIAMTDTGSGMTAEVMKKAFEPFFTTKPVGLGTGLGLSQAFGFVRQSNGHVKLYSELGVGTTVRIYLPRFMGEDQAKPEGPIKKLSPRAVSETILVTEDDVELRKVTVNALRDLGYQVIEAADGHDALQLMDQSERIDLLFTDVVMPRMNGRQLADEALRRRPSLKILFTTGYTQNAVVHNGILDPGVDLIVKPYSIEHLAQKLNEVLGT